MSTKVLVFCFLFGLALLHSCTARLVTSTPVYVINSEPVPPSGFEVQQNKKVIINDQKKTSLPNIDEAPKINDQTASETSSNVKDKATSVSTIPNVSQTPKPREKVSDFGLDYDDPVVSPPMHNPPQD